MSRQRRVEHVVIPELDRLMREAQATNEMLAEASGVACRTIDRARAHGDAIRPHLADCVLEALRTRKFEYKKRGPKHGWKEDT
jgi:hypothetical protein